MMSGPAENLSWVREGEASISKFETFHPDETDSGAAAPLVPVTESRGLVRIRVW